MSAAVSSSWRSTIRHPQGYGVERRDVNDTFYMTGHVATPQGYVDVYGEPANDRGPSWLSLRFIHAGKVHAQSWRGATITTLAITRRAGAFAREIAGA